LTRFSFFFVVEKGSFPLLVAKVVTFGMDVAIWKFLPFEIIELLFQWVPFSILMKFKLVCKEWCLVLENCLFLVAFDSCREKELGFISFSACFPHDLFAASYLNNSGRLYTMVFPFLHCEYKIKCIVGSMILFFMARSCFHTKKYFIVNPFTKTFRNVEVISVGERGFFSLFKKCNPRNYEWLFLKHVFNNMDSHFLVSSRIDNI